MYLLGVTSPGPSLFLVITDTIKFNKMKASFTALGIIVGIIFQVLAVFFILDFLSSFQDLLDNLKILCAIFLLYLSHKYLCDKSIVPVHNNNKRHNFFLKGLLVETLNPLAFGFFISVFTPYALKFTIFSKVFCLSLFILIEGIMLFSIIFIFKISIINSIFRTKVKIINKTCALFFFLFAFKMLMNNVNYLL